MSLLLLFNGAVVVAGRYDGKPRKRYFAKVGEQMLVFGSEVAARNALILAEEPEETISLPAVKKYAKASGQAKEYKKALNSRHYDSLMAMFEQMRDEEDIEVLLMAA